MTMIRVTPDYRLHVEVTHLSTGEQHIRIQSDWRSQERQNVFQATLTPDRVKELATALLCGSYDHKYTERT